MWHMSNYDWMLFLTSPMAFTGDQTHDFVYTKPCVLTLSVNSPILPTELRLMIHFHLTW